MSIHDVLTKHGMFIFVLFNILLTSWRLGNAFLPSQFRRNLNGESSRPYSYLGDDYPLDYPLGDLDAVAMTLQESVHFTLNGSDPVVTAEWESIAAHPDGFGRTRLGPDHRLFVMTFYHQLHCIWKFQQALVDRNDPTASEHHVQHCLNYLRQTFMCEAADSVEEGDFMTRDFEQDRIGDTLVCRDWGKVYDVLDEAYAGWEQWSKKWN
ncbi:uncharacterized protein C8Q71DRAFT_147219 [Rhodofomes roseus]|uniref:Oxidase ustYa n=1 Tax=Rhodofomes roseus TaxID=34475 RepID=A0A4Y9Z542_9APHY|nr:uncharacterized protein C8Q71DRAFT_147219 [Rhodofomes roseus]KAH9834558.1 hypothetical protein C8Q71DRAFT_147219 [Rhodofomes roseus]TFY68449.1 hypothetical protein EVJ58_g991 [Rhodofomes roseus]